MTSPALPAALIGALVAISGVGAEPPSVADRAAAREFPSVFMAWSPATNLPDERRLSNWARHDLVFVSAGAVGLRWNRRPSGLAEGFDPDSVQNGRVVRNRLLELNPNLILLMEVRYRDAAGDFLPEDHPWWKRDASGNRILGWEEGGFFLLDFQSPEYRAQVARQAAAAMTTGVFDGIMLDWWTDDDDRLALVQAVRQAIGEEAIVLVNNNDRQAPRTAPYVNGYFMECWRSKTREDWDRIAATLRFGETHLREPRLNCLETWFQQSRQDLNRMRATTALALTHSDGYCLFSDPNDLPTPDHRHDWYSFWDKRLGQAVSGVMVNPDGSARREFEHGTAVYNPIGNPPLTIAFADPRTSLATGQTASRHTVPPLDGDILLRTSLEATVAPSQTALVASPEAVVIRRGLVDWRLRERGAHLIEDFQDRAVDTERWRIWNSNPDRARFLIEDGRFVIRGEGPIGHNGLWQLNARRFKDVTLVARMNIRSSKPRTHDLCLHLCGGDLPTSPDHWAEVIMQDAGDDMALFKTMVIVEQGGFDQWERSVPLLRGRTDGFLARVSLDGSANLCHLEVQDAVGQWHTIIEPTRLFLRTTHCEIKMRGEQISHADASVRSVGWFDDVRLYPRPAAHPIMVQLVNQAGDQIYRREPDRWPPTVSVDGFPASPLEDLVVELWTADGTVRLARVQSNNFGYYMLPVDHDVWSVFPVSAMIKLSYQGRSLGQVVIPTTGLEGVYPDDVYDLVVE